jgi:hypothetical protein
LAIQKHDDIFRAALTLNPLNETELIKLIDNYVSEPSIAKSMTWLTRNEVVMMSAYAQWALKFDGLNYEEAQNNIDRTKVYDIKICFPDFVQFYRIKDLESMKLHYVELNKQKACNYNSFYPTVERDSVFLDWRKSLDQEWFKGLYGTNYSRLKDTFSSMSTMIPWLKETPEETVLASPFDSFSEILAFFESVFKRSKPMKLLSQGRHFGLSPIDGLISINTRPGFKVVGSFVEERHNVYSLTRNIESRFCQWSELFRVSDQKDQEVLLSEMKQVIVDLINKVD